MAAPPAPKGSITIDRIADIRYPTDPQWSPDSRTVGFLWDSAGKQDLYVAEPGKAPVRVTDFPVNPAMLQTDIGRWEWVSPEQILFLHEGALWSANPANQRVARMPGFDATSGFSLSRDRQEMAFIRRGQVWVTNLKAHTERQVTHLAPDIRVTGVSLSPDGSYVVFNAGHSEDVPDPLPFNGQRMRIFRQNNWDTQLGIVSAFLGDPVMIPTTGGGGGGAGAVQWVTGPHGWGIVRSEMTPDRKTRTLMVTSVKGESRTIWTDHDDAYFTPGRGANAVSSPDGKWIAFISDRSGWQHVYVTPSDATAESQAKQITKGKFTAGYVSWSHDGKKISFAHSSESSPMERFISTADPTTGKIDAIVTAKGVNFDQTFSPDDTKLTWTRTAVDHPMEIYAADLKPGTTPVRLTNSLPDGLQVADLTPPVMVHFPSRAADKKPVPGSLIVNKNLDKTKKNPAIVWIHSDGPNQNYLGWHTDSWRMYYAFHQYLAQQGYVVLTVDYRGSSGYGRDWAVGDYMDMGGKESEDVAAGADYLKTLNYVDPDRIAVWGLSYGGYMTLQAVVTTPTLFRCAIDVAGVGDWATWNPGAYTVARLGTPVANPEGYEKSAAVKHLSKLSRPLMILQGTNDTNVGLWETLTVIDTLEKLGKPFEMAFYPGEIHYFRRGYVLRDAWRRVEEFFDKNLNEQAPVVTSSNN
jgi:dipeptidyl aminopeptidase/acylaminoacyl peptidase